MSRFVPVEELFKGRHFDQEIVVLCVHWYLSFKLSFRDLVAMMSERGLRMAHTTILRWGTVYHYFRSWKNAGVWTCIQQIIYERVRNPSRGAAPGALAYLQRRLGELEGLARSVGSSQACLSDHG